jgi:hypothetical protein
MTKETSLSNQKVRISDLFHLTGYNHKTVIISLHNKENRDFDIVGGNIACPHVDHHGKCKYCGARLTLVGFDSNITKDWEAINGIANGILLDPDVEKVVFVHDFFVPNEYKRVNSMIPTDIKAYRRTIVTPSKQVSIFSKKPTNGYVPYNGHYLNFLSTYTLKDVFWINPVDIERKFSNCTYFDLTPHQSE